MPAKARHVESLTVANWLHRPQRFAVAIERLTADPATRLEGATHIDVPAGASREFKVAFFAYAAGLTHARVTFTSEATREYAFYELKLTAGPPATRGTLALECPVRTQAVARVAIANPLPVDVALRATVTGSRQVTVHPDPPVLRASATTELEVRHRPLLVGASEGALRLECRELGAYEWALRLAGTAVGPERGLAFAVPLGGRETQLFRFTHFAPERAEYRCAFAGGGGGGGAAGAGAGAGAGAAGSSGRRSSAAGADSGDAPGAGAAGFDAPPVVVAPPGPVEVEVEVGFEPHATGEALRDTLLVAHPAAGEYRVPLVGRCGPPKPQGPIAVGDAAAPLPFRNVFPREADFFFAADNPAFVLSRASERIGAKKAATVTVAFRPEAALAAAGGARGGRATSGNSSAGGSAGGSRAGTAAEPAAVTSVPTTAKLTVSCPRQTHSVWVFYLAAATAAAAE